MAATQHAIPIREISRYPLTCCAFLARLSQRQPAALQNNLFKAFGFLHILVLFVLAGQPDQSFSSKTGRSRQNLGAQPNCPRPHPAQKEGNGSPGFKGSPAGPGQRSVCWRGTVFCRYVFCASGAGWSGQHHLRGRGQCKSQNALQGRRGRFLFLFLAHIHQTPNRPPPSPVAGQAWN